MRHARLALVPVLLFAGIVAACGSGGDDDDGATATTAGLGVPRDYSDRGPYAVGEVDLELDADHAVAVFYPVDRNAVEADAEPYRYSGEDLFGPEIVALLPGALSGEIAPPDTWVDVPASGDGPFPIVLHSHGAAGNLRFANLHNSHVASWGYVVVAVDHPERGVVAALEGSLAGDTGGDRDAAADDFALDTNQLLGGLDLVLEESERPESVLSGAADPEQVAAEGHSAGGSASGGAALQDDRIDAWLGQAPSQPVDPAVAVDEYLTEGDGGRPDFDGDAYRADHGPPAVPTLLLAAEGDEVIELADVESIYEWLEAPKRLVVIADSGHAAFVDPCQPIQAEGGLSGFVAALGLDPDEIPLVTLGEDGCLPEDTPVETVWAFIDHVTVAQLESVFDRDRPVAEASLTADYLAETFPDRYGSVEAEGQPG